jgi:hypothetical protein
MKVNNENNCIKHNYICERKDPKIQLGLKFVTP